MRDRWNALQSKKKVALIGAIVVIIAAIAGIAVATSGGKNSPKAAIGTSTTTTSPSSVTTTTGLTVPPGYCPLTDVHAPDGVPDRPALAVKIGNEPGTSRPQSGLNEADIVFDTPAEGFLMRYVAVYQCTDAAQIGPNRSVRWVDWRLIRQMGHPILAFAGGIDPNLNTIASFKWLVGDDLLTNAGVAGIRTTNRVPPDNLYTSTAGLYALSPVFNKKYGPPTPIFRYSATPPVGSKPAASVSINFSSGTDATWTWNASLGVWLHSYADGGPDIDALTNTQVNTTNIVVLVVKYKFGPYSEHGCCSGDFESQTIGKGSGFIFRNGQYIKVTWSRRFVVDPWTFTDAAGKVVALAPGRTWVELLPNTTYAAAGNFTITP